jgi:hypothetical protein
VAQAQVEGITLLTVDASVAQSHRLFCCSNLCARPSKAACLSTARC